MQYFGEGKVSVGIDAFLYMSPLFGTQMVAYYMCCSIFAVFH